MPAISLNVPSTNGAPANITLADGDVLYVLGANGTGKSNLLQRFQTAHQQNSKRILAHRNTSFQGNAVNITPSDRRSLANNIRNSDIQPRSRTFDSYAESRPNAALFDLLSAENKRARGIASAVDRDDAALVAQLKSNNAPIKEINNLLQLSNLPIEISLGVNDELLASKSRGPTYSIAELSDGERNALLIASEILTLDSGTLILVDEPERHLHRSIVSPLLLSLFAMRKDCKFVISTHDLTLPLDNPEAQILLVRDCQYNDNQLQGWQFDLLAGGAEIDDEIKKDLLGARKKILYVEGKEHSLDRSLYSLILPGVSIIPRGSCAQIERIVPGIRAEASLNWVSAFGLVDNDRRPAAQVATLKTPGVYALSVYHVESIYYHPDLQIKLLQGNGDVQNLITQARDAALVQIKAQIPFLTQWVSEKKIRAQIFARLPKKSDMANPRPINISIDVAAVIAQEAQYLTALCDANNLSAIIENYPVRNTSALSAIAVKLGFPSKTKYEEAVRQLLMRDPAAVAVVRTWFGDLYAAINAQ